MASIRYERGAQAKEFVERKEVQPPAPKEEPFFVRPTGCMPGTPCYNNAQADKDNDNTMLILGAIALFLLMRKK